MSPSARRIATVGAVLLGALLLFGPITYLVVVRAVEVLAGFAGMAAPLAGWPELVLSLLALAVALAVVTEAAAARLQGGGALRRGSRRQRLARHLVLSGVLLAAVVVLVDRLAVVVLRSLAGDRPVVLLLALGVAVALAWAAVRAATAFVGGLRGA